MLPLLARFTLFFWGPQSAQRLAREPHFPPGAVHNGQGMTTKLDALTAGLATVGVFWGAYMQSYEGVVLMECGAEDACDGKSQDWKATPIPGKAETYMFASAASSASSAVMGALSSLLRAAGSLLSHFGSRRADWAF